MADIIPFKHPAPAHANGDAECASCGHTWHAVAPIGVIKLQCPACLKEEGRYLHKFRPAEGEFMLLCGNCGGETWVLTPDGALCESCGVFNFDIDVNC